MSIKYLTDYLVESILGKKEAVSLFPGGYKPPTLGHFHIVDEISKRPEIQKVIVLIGLKERDGITAQDSLKIWNIYKKYLNDKVEFQISKSASPITDVYDILKANPQNSYFLVFGRDEDPNRFKSAQKYPNAKIINFKEVENISGTLARETIKADNYEGFQKYLPTELNDEERKEVWSIVNHKEINESKYHNKLVAMALRKDPECLTEFGMEYLPEIIVKQGNKFLVKTKDDSRTLGTHTNREDAVKQLQAIEASKHTHVNEETKQIIDEKQLNLIAKKVMEKYPQINNGGCAQFALAIHDIFGFNKFFLFYEDNSNFPTHVSLNINNKIYDPEGIYDVGSLKNVIKNSSLEEVLLYRKELGDLYDQNELENFIRSIKIGIQESDKIGIKAYSREVQINEYENKKTLNPNIFENNKIVVPKVREVLLKIVNYFWSKTESTQPYQDVLLLGSSANYNWNKYSDVDVHILVDYSKYADPETTKKYYDELKANWNKNHKLKLGNQFIELYIQPTEEKNHAEGVYSLLNNKWIKQPTYQSVEIPDEEINIKADPFKIEIDSLIENPDLEQIELIQKRLKNFRQAGLEEGGEYSIENLAFKELRNEGYLDKLAELKNQVVDKELVNEVKQPNPQFLEYLNKFIDYGCNELQIPKTEVELINNDDYSQTNHSFGGYDPNTKKIYLVIKNRNLSDLTRTLFHEQTHAKQDLENRLTNESGNDGSDIENEANSKAGEMMRELNRKYPEILTMVNV